MTVRFPRSLIATTAIFFAGCSFSKDPYLFTGLADVPFIVVPDASSCPSGGCADAGPDLDAASPELDAGIADSGADAGVTPEDAATFPDARPTYHTAQAIETSGTDQGLSGAAAGFLPSNGAARTVELWVKGASSGRSGRLFGYGVQGHSFDLLMLASPGAENSHLILLDGFDAVTSSMSPALSDPAWHHVAVTMTATAAPDSSSLVTFLVDGEVIGQRRKGGNDVARDDAHRLIIGGDASDPIGFQMGQLDEVRLWNVARTPAEIARDRATIISSAPGLVGYWAMDGIGAGPGISVPNQATVTGTAAAPSLFTVGGVQFVESTAF